jgi:hypothetical protein
VGAEEAEAEAEEVASVMAVVAPLPVVIAHRLCGFGGHCLLSPVASPVPAHRD